jgi:biopolymer transport protein ExbD
VKTIVLVTLCASLLAGIRSATATAESNLSILQRRETVRITEQGKIFVGDRETPLQQLARRLRREGVAQSDTVYISIPEETPNRVLVDVSRELATRGYRRVIFTKPLRTTAESKPE